MLLQKQALLYLKKTTNYSPPTISTANLCHFFSALCYKTIYTGVLQMHTLHCMLLH